MQTSSHKANYHSQQTFQISHFNKLSLGAVMSALSSEIEPAGLLFVKPWSSASLPAFTGLFTLRGSAF
ncbi:hypothetical protein DUNSADRAFT_2866 [Dunaliella salina]|uniref:Encoded protein n=1 Tax=Dunaliella salina TaxID=3046 RepID=A0ABQ7FVV0_DUNSA|nr:hypothetical protein DUNSADRAFT_2866 [Dunaliella salina]|eukprot:KAF5826513.1 hypothetical protein DUNSADRAFT_2866 [Dunaliella salina]